jgi:hypothetical protein
MPTQDPIATLNENEADPLVVFAKAHQAVSRVTPRAHDDVVLAVARALLKNRSVDRNTVNIIVLEKDPIARELHLDMQRSPMSIEADPGEP